MGAAEIVAQQKFSEYYLIVSILKSFVGPFKLPKIVKTKLARQKSALSGNAESSFGIFS